MAMVRKSFLFLSISAVFLLLLGVPAASTAAQAGSAYDLITAVNPLRAANGLPAYEVDGPLMAIAQAHSDYQASIGSVTHTGSGGAIFISENSAGGRNLSPQGAVAWWQGDSTHLNTMLSESYQETGAGAAIAGGSLYYTLDVGSTVASSGENIQTTPIPDPNPEPDPGGTPPFVTASAQADGSIIHEVQAGQTLIGIALAYDMPLADLLALNELGQNAFIFPGDKLLIQEAFTPTPSATPTPTATSPRPTRRPPPTVTPTPVTLAKASTSDGEGPAASSASPATPAFPQELEMDVERSPMVLVVVAVAFLFLIAPFLLILKRRII